MFRTDRVHIKKKWKQTRENEYTNTKYIKYTLKHKIEIKMFRTTRDHIKHNCEQAQENEDN